jgi:hypothetical protein
VLAFQYEKRDVEVFNSLENSTAALSKCFWASERTFEEIWRKNKLGMIYDPSVTPPPIGLWWRNRKAASFFCFLWCIHSWCVAVSCRANAAFKYCKCIEK